jgi:CheY-like chemotaxis protein
MSAIARVRPLRVLVVEDCPDTRDSLGVLLGRWGHQVDLATELAPPDLFRLLTDVESAAQLLTPSTVALQAPRLDGC